MASTTQKHYTLGEKEHPKQTECPSTIAKRRQINNLLLTRIRKLNKQKREENIGQTEEKKKQNPEKAQHTKKRTPNAALNFQRHQHIPFNQRLSTNLNFSIILDH
ncbi:MAG: hypothetical protein ACFFBD_07620 [Candidatus Hodarchaeota archaeon]